MKLLHPILQWLNRNNLPNMGMNCKINKDVSFARNIKGVTFGNYVKIEPHAYIRCHNNSTITIGDKTTIGHGTHLDTGREGSNIKIGNNCSINVYSVVYGTGGLVIGDNVRIATHTVIIPANHVFDDPDATIKSQGADMRGVRIDDDVWIGAGVIILPGAHIGKGCVIGAGSVVTKVIPPYSVVMGVPGKVVRKRGDKQ